MHARTASGDATHASTATSKSVIEHQLVPSEVATGDPPAPAEQKAEGPLPLPALLDAEGNPTNCTVATPKRFRDALLITLAVRSNFTPGRLVLMNDPKQGDLRDDVICLARGFDRPVEYTLLNGDAIEKARRNHKKIPDPKYRRRDEPLTPRHKPYKDISECPYKLDGKDGLRRKVDLAFRYLSEREKNNRINLGQQLQTWKDRLLVWEGAAECWGTASKQDREKLAMAEGKDDWSKLTRLKKDLRKKHWDRLSEKEMDGFAAEQVAHCKAQITRVVTKLGGFKVFGTPNWTCFIPDPDYTGKCEVRRKKGRWALTEEGVREARKIALRTRSTNMTSKWYETHPEVRARMCRYLEKKLQVSAAAQIIEDHIGNFILAQISRDAIARHVASKGEEPTQNEVLGWLARSCRSDFRRRGRDPVSRALWGTKTEDEYLAGKNGTASVFNPEDGARRIERRDLKNQGIHLVQGGADSDNAGCLMDMEDESAEEGVLSWERADAYNALWRAFRTVLKQDFPESGARYFKILRWHTLGLTNDEIAHKLGVAKLRARNILQDTKRALVEAAHAGRLEAEYAPIREMEGRSAMSESELSGILQALRENSDLSGSNQSLSA